MSNTPEKWVAEWGKGKSISSLAKKSRKDLKEGIYSLFDSNEGIPCSEDEKCPYYRIKVWNVWRLLDKKWWEPILEADKVIDEEEEIGRFLESTSIIRIFHSDSGWWFIADNWTIVTGDYINMGLYDLEIDNYQYIIASWKTLENWHEKTRYFSLKDWFKTEDLELMKQKCIEENPYHNSEKKNSKNDNRKKFQDKVKSTIKETGKAVKENFDKFADLYVDEQYNMRLRRKFSLKQWTKQWYSFMKNWKVWIMWILEPKYDELEPCSDNFIWMRSWKKRWLLDADGNMVIEPKYDKIYEDGRVMLDKKYWLVDMETGKEIIEPKYDKIYEDGRVMLVNKYIKDGRERSKRIYWLVNRETGKEIIAPKYDEIYKDGRVWLDNKMWLVNRETWEEIIAPKYDEIDSDSNQVWKENKTWLIDKKTWKEIIECKYDDLLFFKGYSLVIPVDWNNYWLFSKIDWSVIKAVDFDAVRRNSKKWEITFIKKGRPREVLDCSPYKEAA